MFAFIHRLSDGDSKKDGLSMISRGLKAILPSTHPSVSADDSSMSVQSIRTGNIRGPGR